MSSDGAPPTSGFALTVNGQPCRVAGEDTQLPLLEWLRLTGRTGSKQGCAEGDCGACTVALVERDAAGRPTYRAINSCIALLPMFAGREIVTVEGLAGTVAEAALLPALAEAPLFRDPDGRALHPVQQAMVRNYGSQCGYCTPGFVVSMFEAYERSCAGERMTGPRLADQLCGNLCRCTGYRPIRDAAVEAIEVGARLASATTLVEVDALTRRLHQPLPAVPALDYRQGEARFCRPTMLEDLLRELRDDPEAVLIAGATEIGVEINKKAKRFPRLVSTEGVADLHLVDRLRRGPTGAERSGWWIGGAASLTRVEETLAGAIPALDKMLWVFASRQIRSRATLAGNIVTASPIGDLAPILLALDATVELARLDEAGTVLCREVDIVHFFTGYRKTVRRRDEVVTGVFLPDAAAGITRHLETYKVSKRRELDISIVAACFRADVNADGSIVAARLAYGGVAATPLRATEAEALLSGRAWPLDGATMMATSQALGRAYSPLSDVRSGEAYRRGLIVTLFEKWISGEASESQDLPLDFLRGVDGPPPDDSRALRHESAIGHVTGQAQYVDDSAYRRGRGQTLEIWPVMAPHARAQILRRDASRARALPGVVAVLLAEDIPGDNDVGAVRKDEPLLADREISFHGQLVAIVVGESVEICRRAAALVEVEYAPLPPILGIAQAIAAGSFHSAPHRIHRGDCAAALAASPHRLKGRFEIGGQEHFYLETQAAYAERGDDGDLYVVSSTQHPAEIQGIVSHVLRLPRSKVVVQSPRMGGGFGGKETQGNTWAAIVALAAWKTGRPVRVQLDRDLDMVLTGKRHPFLASYEVGFEADGRLRALSAELVSDGGWALDLSESILDRALFHIDNGYYLPAIDVVGRVAKTNHVSNTAFRGFGGPQGMLVIEEVLDRVARQLGLPPEEVRERNLYNGSGETNTTHYGMAIGDNRLPQMWGALKKSAEFVARRREISAFNDEHARRKRGLAMTPVKFGISFTASFLNQAGALVLLYRDGTCQVNHGGTEMGQGLYTKMLGIAMRELGLDAASIRVMKTQTDKVPNTSATAASAGADLNGQAVKHACEQLRERLWPVALKLFAERGVEAHAASIVAKNGELWSPLAPETRISYAMLCERAYLEQIALSATGFYRTPNIHYDKARGQGKPFHYFACGVAVVEVEVDAQSGMKRVRRVDLLHDVGDSLNPGVDRGQVEGGFVQGLGWLTGEELSWDKDGRLLSHSASTYQIPAISDAPVDFRVTLLPDAAQHNTIHGSKAVGEPPLMLALAAREAIRDAVAAFARSGVTEVPLASPATHEAIYAAIAGLRG